jgi:excisionase family DNA binding protein
MDLMRAELGGEVCTPGGDPRPEKAKIPWHIDNPRSENGRFGDQRPLSLPEAARYLNVTDRYIRRLVAEQRIAYFKVGRLLRFAAIDLDAYLAACRVEPAASHPLLGPRATRS